MTATETLTALRPGDLEYAQGEQERKTTRRNRLVIAGLLIPGVIGLTVSYLLPLLWMIRMSFDRGEPNGIVHNTFTLDMFARALGDPYYWRVIGNTFTMGILVSTLCILVSYPIALFLHRTTSRWKGLLIAAAIAPLLTSAVVRTYGWMVILGSHGVVNQALMGTGVIPSPLKLTNNMTGVNIGLVEIFMPYAILAMLSGFGRLNPQLEEAAGSLGANKARAFFRVTLPLSLPGVLTGFLLVFVLTISTFVTPRLLGGGTVQVLATEVYDQTTGLLNWPFAAALSVILLILFGLFIGAYQLITKRLGPQ